MIKYKFTENKLYSQFFSFEILDYYDSIATDENFEWIENYFNILMKDENINTEKFNVHHIRPCCTFKDKEHKNRRETEKLGNEFNGNLIKLSIYNHFFAHYYLWKIFNNRDLKNAFQRMCGQGKYINNLTKEELNDIARLKENCAKKNKTDKEKKEYISNYNKTHKKEQKQYYKKNIKRITENNKKYAQNNKEKMSKYKSKWQKENKEKRKNNYQKNRNKILNQKREYYNNNKEKFRNYRKINKEKISEYNKNYNKNNKDKIREIKANYHKKNKDKISEKRKKFNAQTCYDPKKEDFCTFGALQSRKKRNKELYKNINLKDCIIKS